VHEDGTATLSDLGDDGATAIKVDQNVLHRMIIDL
jgi:hypothetical protein